MFPTQADPMIWSPDDWRGFEARQQPAYPDRQALEAVLAGLAARPALVRIEDIDALTARLADVQTGCALLLQAGDCAERLSDGVTDALATAALIAGLADAIETDSGLPVVRIGRIAGQFAKPRSHELERRGGHALPVWRGDNVNAMAFNDAARTADPTRLLAAHDHAAATLTALGGALFTSHEALLLPFEHALIRHDRRSGRWFAGSAHLLWIGARTLFADSAHVELLRGLANPIGLKCGPDLASDELLPIIERLNPDGEAGRITLIIRMGTGGIETALPSLIRGVGRSRHPVLWCCDPLHGNTIRAADGTKQRDMARIAAETRAFMALVKAERVRGGGLHLELTHRDVIECDGPGSRDDCRDPRLNPDQALAIARLFAARARHPVPALA